MNKKVFWILSLILSLAIALVIAGSLYYKSQDQKLKRLQIKAAVWPGFMPVILAQELGYFKDEGIEVDISYSSNAKQILMEFEAGAYDGIFWNLSAFLPLKNAKTIRFLFASDSSTTGNAIVSYEPINGPLDLKGKRVSAIHGGYGELFVISMLNKYNLRENDVTWIMLNDEKEGIDQLVKKKIDAIHIWEPYVSQALKAGAHTIFTAEELSGLIVDGFAVHERVLKEKKEILKSFTRAWFRAIDFWLANKEEGGAIIAQHLKMRRDEVLYDGMKLYTLADNLKAFQKKDDFSSLHHVVQFSSSFYMQKNIMLYPLEGDNLIAPEIVQELSQEKKP